MVRVMVPIRGPHVLPVALAAAMTLGGTLAVSRLIPSAAGESLPVAQLQNVAMAGLGAQFGALRAADDSGLRSVFTGKALAVELALKDHVRSLMQSGQDYPGDSQFTNVQFLDLYGDPNSVTTDIAVHAKLANMRAGALSDYSESDLIFHVVLTKDATGWRVTDISSQFAPGAEP